MAQEFYTLLTNIGLAKLTNAQITQSALEITHLALGDSSGTYYEPTQAATSLRNERWRGRVAKVEQDANNPNWVVVEISVPASVGGWSIREIGLFDVEGSLIAIGKHPETYKPLLTSGSAKDLLIQMIIEVNNADSVELKIDPNIIVASRSYVDDEVAKVENPGAATVAELARGLRAMAFEQERFNKQTLMQGTGTISAGEHNGYFRTSVAFTSIAFDGFGQQNAPNYQVMLTPISGDVNLIGELIAYDKTRNGFKVKMTGSAANVTFNWAIVNKLV